VALQVVGGGRAVGPLAGGAIETHGELRESRAWSTMKVPVIVAAIAAGHADWEAIEAAVTRSDNDAALRLWDRLDDGAAQVEAVLREAGDDGRRDPAHPLQGWLGPERGTAGRLRGDPGGDRRPQGHRDCGPRA
jgi:hypothetical protein